MSQANPFAPLRPPPLAAALRDAPSLPSALMGVALLVGVIGVLTALIMQWLMYADGPGHWSLLLRYAVPAWIGHLPMMGLCVYWFAQVYLERHGLGDYRQPAWLLFGYGAVSLLLSCLVGYAMSHVYAWLYEAVDMLGRSSRMLGDLVWWLSRLLRFCLESLLPLWLLLRLFRSRAEVVAGDLRVAGTSLAWCFALGVVLAYLQLSDLAMRVLGGFAYGYALDGWEGLVALVHGLFCALLAFFAARRALPSQVRGFNGGRLALACLITLLLWIASAVNGAVLLLLLLLFGGGGETLLLLLFGLVQFALLWPFSLLGLRWGYRAQAVGEGGV